MTMIYSIGDLSGAHINPAVSIAFRDPSDGFPGQDTNRGTRFSQVRAERLCGGRSQAICAPCCWGSARTQLGTVNDDDFAQPQSRRGALEAEMNERWRILKCGW